ncbi:phosphopantetheine-binding protein [Mycobacterium sp. 852013-50091_SCH5140682]|uniref:phosphopantetheine-binding protein n=1 Tax=Mycobacterium sp. 852013-50091_SCH5140682 TaxID=1834109 RepID=UPI0007E952E3|nr:phosphopantetheine-binding protein [Mycobacterium sp. 852013-50091_SCH5140682]OBC07550.1 phosphopantetheine-binding protein [Mycobacterium sp. 852013-50091_SCH5140682]
MTSPTEQAPSLTAVTDDIIAMIRAEMPTLKLTAESSLLDGGLDSLRVMSLVLRIENRWEIDLDADDADELLTVGDLGRLVLRRIMEKQS